METTGKNLMNRDYLSSLNHDTIYILAPGPNGVDHWRDIPIGSFVICVNKAIELIYHVANCNALWLVAELSAMQTNWFTDYRFRFIDILCIGNALVTPGGMEPHEYHKVFDYWGSVPGESIALVTDKLCMYGTVSCMAVQLAYHMGAKKIILCGVDMFGENYYDGSQGMYDRKDTPWHCHINGFNELIREMSKTTEILTLSPTQLDIRGVANAS